MPEQVPHEPRDFAFVQINTLVESLRNIEALPNGRPRDLDGPTAIGVLTGRSNLAIASALLALADAVRANSEA